MDLFMVCTALNNIIIKIHVFFMYLYLELVL